MNVTNNMLLGAVRNHPFAVLRTNGREVPLMTQSKASDGLGSQVGSKHSLFAGADRIHLSWKFNLYIWEFWVEKLIVVLKNVSKIIFLSSKGSKRKRNRGEGKKVHVIYSPFSCLLLYS